MAAILYSEIQHCMNAYNGINFDIELICLEHTLIVLRNTLQISIEAEVRTHIGRILILLSQQIGLLRVYEVLIK